MYSMKLIYVRTFASTTLVGGLRNLLFTFGRLLQLLISRSMLCWGLGLSLICANSITPHARQRSCNKKASSLLELEQVNRRFCSLPACTVRCPGGLAELTHRSGLDSARSALALSSTKAVGNVARICCRGFPLPEMEAIAGDLAP